MVSRWGIVSDGLVENVVMWDGDRNGWAPPEGRTAHRLPDDSPVSPGWTRARNGRFVRPNLEPTVEAVPLTVDPAAVVALLDAVQQPDADVRQALADFAEALNPTGA